jgi:thioredoxin-dependent peroxiredoxin
MRRVAWFVAVLSALGLTLGRPEPSLAQLSVGAPAPQFALDAALGGTTMRFDLDAALTHGPVVVYFFPKSFTEGCTAEAHAFAAHIEEFRALDATVIGVSGDDLATQRRFSSSECAAKFLVAADPGLHVAKRYDAVVLNLFANRTSYVIGRDGRVAYAYTSLDPDHHVANLLAALRAQAH